MSAEYPGWEPSVVADDSGRTFSVLMKADTRYCIEQRVLDQLAPTDRLPFLEAAYHKGCPHD